MPRPRPRPRPRVFLGPAALGGTAVMGADGAEVYSLAQWLFIVDEMRGGEIFDFGHACLLSPVGHSEVD